MREKCVGEAFFQPFTNTLSKTLLSSNLWKIKRRLNDVVKRRVEERKFLERRESKSCKP
jgi:hypothetical protein